MQNHNPEKGRVLNIFSETRRHWRPKSKCINFERCVGGEERACVNVAPVAYKNVGGRPQIMHLGRSTISGGGSGSAAREPVHLWGGHQQSQVRPPAHLRPPQGPCALKLGHARAN